VAAEGEANLAAHKALSFLFLRTETNFLRPLGMSGCKKSLMLLL
jgi:hypothetical protein